MNPQEEIEKLIAFWDKVKDGPPLRVDGGVMATPGCEPGTMCCAETFDFAGFVDAMRELVE